MKIEFISGGIKEVKTRFSERQLKNIERTAERFRIDMLAKYDLLRTKAPHAIRIKG